MEILGIGPLELFFIIIIALIVLGPKDMVKAGKTIGRFLRKLVTSPSWHTIQQTSRELKHLPNKLMSEAGLDEIQKDLNLKEIENEIGIKEIHQNLNEIKSDIDKDLSEWITPPTDSIQQNPNDSEVATKTSVPESDPQKDSSPETIVNNSQTSQSTSDI